MTFRATSVQPMDTPLVRSLLQVNGIACFLGTLACRNLSLSTLMKVVLVDHPKENSLASLGILWHTSQERKECVCLGWLFVYWYVETVRCNVSVGRCWELLPLDHSGVLPLGYGGAGSLYPVSGVVLLVGLRPV